MATTEWTVLEKLLLSQAVYKYGEDNWFQIARNLKHHALLDRPADYFNQKNCSLQYYLMVEELSKEKRNALNQDMPVVVQLARQLYNLRLEELKKAIKEDEDKILNLVTEIDDIRAGKWDDKLLSSVKDSQNSTDIQSNEEEEEEDPINTHTIKEEVNTQAESDVMTNTQSTSLPITNSSPIPISITTEPALDTNHSTSVLVDKEEQQKPNADDQSINEEKNQVEKENAKVVRQEDTSTAIEQSEEVTPETRKEDDNKNEIKFETVKRLESVITGEAESLAPIIGSIEKEDHEIKKVSIPEINITTSSQTNNNELVQTIKKEQEEISESRKRQPENVDNRDEPNLKRQKTEDLNTSITETLTEEEINNNTDREIEPLVIDTTRIDYSPVFIDVSQGTTPADTSDINLRDGTESVAGSESNAATPTTERRRGLSKDDQRHKSWQKNINLLWREIANHKNGAMFMNPIKENIAPHYYDIVKRPMDLKTIKNRIRDGVNQSLVYGKHFLLSI
ncbi:uncharacterized protein BX663DRAFT_158061 [Cokeromyces recurvatus]|uniref:uncharacterized protein n=1 Tax=Cokeromyces recurvatus TaxID=90255 RepID=UPI00221EB64B|nr:uncharacterized protein BX663DRAFT_158061 [Cokeromyces recurvatus]KAI7900471.1 hypothetical protein BX663DRAFT_158061 [Cokeromyces recurvatus]